MTFSAASPAVACTAGFLLPPLLPVRSEWLRINFIWDPNPVGYTASHSTFKPPDATEITRSGQDRILHLDACFTFWPIVLHHRFTALSYLNKYLRTLPLDFTDILGHITRLMPVWILSSILYLHFVNIFNDRDRLKKIHIPFETNFLIANSANGHPTASDTHHEITIPRT